ncbi:heme peroxidase [Auriculariales sp. MPI-PUGE-AT-0066]|nr:heme peroxidase [Auriculariales sp. MPI-PUGE-AT-0066]
MLGTMTSTASTVYNTASQLAELAILGHRPIVDDGKHDRHAKAMQVMDNLERQWKVGLPLPSLSAMDAIFDAFSHADTIGLDDRKMLLEEILTVLSRLPKGSWLGQQLENNVIALFYKDLPHPPATWLGRPPLLPSYLSMSPTPSTTSPFNSIFLNKQNSISGNPIGPVTGTNGTNGSSQVAADSEGAPYPPPDVFAGKPYAHRMPDGANNNPLFPDLGRAGMPYARSVAPTRPVPLSSLPDAGVLFDVLLRRDKFTEHPSGINSLFFAFANIIIHSLFRTSRTQHTINDTSSYLDLSPLYGNNEEQQDKIRIKDGRGLMKNDCFADERLLLMPEASAALLVLFCRNHNYVAEHILQINEQGKFHEPTEEWTANNPTAMNEQDDEIFNKARLVNCGYFMQVILGDYIGTITRTMADGSDWCLDPLQTIRTAKHDLVPRGEGNVVSVEFNLLYRWHATLSKEDEEWLTNDVFGRIYPGKAPDTITPMEFGRNLRGMMSKFSKDPSEWEWGSLKRQPDGKFSDDDLSRVLRQATSTVAGAFRARGTPAVMRVVEIFAIEQARKWGVCSLNEFRKFLGLKPYQSFEEWNPDPAIHIPAMRLYGDIEHLELYVGLQAEEAKSPRSGAGLCPGYTISRAILADAICLVRGDRFLTTDFTPFNLSSWGYQDCARTLDNGSRGGQLSKLLMRTLPNNYNDRSIYAHFPMMIPSVMREHLTRQGVADQYDFEMRSTYKVVKVVDTAEGVRNALKDWRTFRSSYGDSMKEITNGYGTYLAWDDTLKHRRDRLLIRDALFTSVQIDRYARFFFDTTRELIRQKSYSLVHSDVRSVDIVRDVVNLVPVHWASTQVAGISLKTPTTPRGANTEMEVYQMCAVMFEFMFLNTRPHAGWKLREQSKQFSQRLLTQITAHLDHITHGSISIAKARDTLVHWLVGQDDHAHDFLKNLVKMNTNATAEELAYTVLGTMVASVPNYGQAAAHVINFYLDEARKAEKEHICRLALRVDDESDKLLTGYVLEALRLDPQSPGVFRDVTADAEINMGKSRPKLKVRRGECLLVSLAKANVDKDVFGENPREIDINREQKIICYSVTVQQLSLGTSLSKRPCLKSCVRSSASKTSVALPATPDTSKGSSYCAVA